MQKWEPFAIGSRKWQTWCLSLWDNWKQKDTFSVYNSAFLFRDPTEQRVSLVWQGKKASVLLNTYRFVTEFVCGVKQCYTPSWNGAIEVRVVVVNYSSLKCAVIILLVKEIADRNGWVIESYWDYTKHHIQWANRWWSMSISLKLNI